MTPDIRQAILVVSFGTSYPETRKVTIDAIETDIAAAFPDFRVYRAWTSRMILARLKKRDGIHISNIPEAMEQMAADGITKVIVQPTHIINGLENDRMIGEVLDYRDRFDSISFGTPLLTSQQDMEEIILAMADAFRSADEDSALVLMGHGTAHYANTVYAALDYAFKDLGYPRFFIGTVEAYPSVESLLRQVRKTGLKKVVLSPFMIVAGDHAANDLAGDSPDSWLSRFLAEGYETSVILRGLGEYESVRRILIRHVREAM